MAGLIIGRSFPSLTFVAGRMMGRSLTLVAGLMTGSSADLPTLVAGRIIGTPCEVIKG